MSEMTTAEIADDLVNRLLAGEAWTAREIALDLREDRDKVSRAIQLARDVLRDQYGVVLPVANVWTEPEYILRITYEAREAFFGQLPQIRKLRTSAQNVVRNMTASMALATVKPRQATALVTALSGAVDNLDNVIGVAEGYMVDYIEEGKR